MFSVCSVVENRAPVNGYHVLLASLHQSAQVLLGLCEHIAGLQPRMMDESVGVGLPLGSESSSLPFLFFFLMRRILPHSLSDSEG